MEKVLDKLLEDKLKELGFDNVTEQNDKVKEMRRKLAIAYENYRYVTLEKINKFNEKLMKESREKNGDYKCLTFVSTKETDLVPPVEVLSKLKEAKDRQCFDEFEIGYIKKVKDPILFGRINDCDNRFFIAQWDDDVKIEDILAPNEG